MAKQREQANAEWRRINNPSREEVEQLRKDLQGYKQERVNGQLQRRFDLYCKTMGIIRFDEKGNRVILQEADYTRLNRINTKLEEIEYWERDAYLKSHPEEREKVSYQLKKMGEDLRKKFGIKHENT